MNGMKYLRYQYADILSTALGTLTWMSLGAYMLLAKSAIGEKGIPIADLLIFTAGLIGVKLAFNITAKIQTYKALKLIGILIETVFLVTLYTVIDDYYVSGITIYTVIIIKPAMRRILEEQKRHLEDFELTNRHYKRYLKKIRKISGNTDLLSAAIGSGIAAITLTLLNADIIAFTKVMLVFNVIQNLYDYWVWHKYLR